MEIVESRVWKCSGPHLRGVGTLNGMFGGVLLEIMAEVLEVQVSFACTC